mmetsp:Transcript_32939/g.105087  ORF Transcript_32939/g.105087 Transcript_32939/m.105087 type:complete len:205 (-) Transcript_32939:443-1057(-)
MPEPRPPRPLRALHPGPRRPERRLRRRRFSASHLRPDPTRRHPRERTLQDVRSPQGRDRQPPSLLGLPPLLHAHGRPPRSHPPHDDPQELRLLALHHRPRHGRLQVLHRRKRLLRSLRRPGLRQGERTHPRRPGRPLPQPRLHRRKGLHHRRRSQGRGPRLPQALRHQVPQNAQGRRRHPRVVRLQIRRRRPQGSAQLAAAFFD